MKRWIMGVICLMVSGFSLAAGPREVRKQVQATMLVTGSITVTPDGSVNRYQVDHPEQLPAPVVSLISQNAPNWRFEPVMRGGQPVLAKAAMSLRVVATPTSDGNYLLSIAGSHFGAPASGKDPSGKRISVLHESAPRYPINAAMARVSGTVYLVLRVTRDGVVDRSAAEQVNLDMVASETEMQHWRDVLGNAARRAAMRWTFTPPTSGPEATRSFWVVTVPTVFRLIRRGQPKAIEKYGAWHAYVPGPRNMPDWMMHEPGVGGSADAVAAGSTTEVGDGLRLTTPLNGA
ncbi:MAG: energy transducer TonB [Rhodanobacter sp.]